MIQAALTLGDLGVQVSVSPIGVIGTLPETKGQFAPEGHRHFKRNRLSSNQQISGDMFVCVGVYVYIVGPCFVIHRRSHEVFQAPKAWQKFNLQIWSKRKVKLSSRGDSVYDRVTFCTPMCTC